MILTSDAFSHGREISSDYTCEGCDTSPSLSWSEVDARTKSLALIVDDPDAHDPAAPKTTWVHWVLYNIPPTASGLVAGATGDSLPGGAQEGVNDWKRIRLRRPLSSNWTASILPQAVCARRRTSASTPSDQS